MKMFVSTLGSGQQEPLPPASCPSGISLDFPYVFGFDWNTEGCVVSEGNP